MQRKKSRLVKAITLFSLLSVVAPALAQEAPPKAYPGIVTVNYVRSWNARIPESDPDLLKAKPDRDVVQSTSYIDGFGRPLQTVIKNGSFETGGSAADMVAPVVYDEMGREQYKYLPFAANSTASNPSVSDGAFKLNPFQQQQSFMTGQYGGQGETFFYSKTNFEASPLNRTEKSMAPGNSWVGSNRGVEAKYWINTVGDDVKKWTVTNVVNNWGTYAVTGIYPAGELLKNITVDEHSKQVIEYKDKEGKVILKKVQLTASADDGTGTGYPGWLCTYYIYDDLNNLRCVIQPEGVKTLSQNGWMIDYSALGLAAEQCFRYEYDGQNRLIKKKVPGAGEVWMVYDAASRQVMIQDAGLRSQQKWMYTLYDNFSRPVSTGLITDAANYNNHSFHTSAAYSSLSYPAVSSFQNEELTRTFYENYTWLTTYGNPISSSYNSSYDTYFEAASNSVFPYPQANSPTSLLKGLATGSRVKILGSADYLYTINFYDEQGRIIQIQSTNITGGTDIVTTQYTWAGQPLVIIQKQEKQGASAMTNVVVTKMTYDDLGRVAKTEKKVSNTMVNSGGMPGYKIIKENEYDKLGQLKKKKLAPTYGTSGLETENFEYNIRGWILGMNRDYARDVNNNNYFGFDLGYDKGSNNIIGSQNYANPQYNGNIEGMVWKSKGDGEKRKYDFSYDAANRLLKADFSQYTGSVFNQTAGINFDMKMGDGLNPASAYDDNGNIKQMQQWGLKLNGSTQIDNLSYLYQPGTNKLARVTDLIPGDNKLGDFKDGVNANDDYSYDDNGNMILDNNKAISTISYNYLNLPSVITITGKGTITYTYDATGNKIRKTVLDNSVSPAKTTTTLYLSGAIYENDMLQFINHEEGRIRYKPAEGVNPASIQYDYLLKDHLGNVRMVLTEEQKTDMYPAATMEIGSAATEEIFYSNLPQTRVSVPNNYPANTPAGNAYVAVLQGNDGGGTDVAMIGPAIALKVMAGDKFNLQVNSWWENIGRPQPPANPFNELLNAISTSIGGISGGHATSLELQNSSVLSSSVTAFLNSQTYNSYNAKAFINWILFDEQFNYVSSSSGFEQVGDANSYATHIRTDMPIDKSGYLYIYVSNASTNFQVFFDNLQVTHIRGPILEETHYYPFGLTMGGISTKALNNVFENKLKYNDGTELESKEFSDGSGIELYATTFRSYDPQLARFHQIDPLAEATEDFSVFAYCNNNPILYNDPLGLDTTISGVNLTDNEYQYHTILPSKPRRNNPSTGFIIPPAIKTPIWTKSPTNVPSITQTPKTPLATPKGLSKVGALLKPASLTVLGILMPLDAGGALSCGCEAFVVCPHSNPHNNPYPGHGNDNANWNPHAVYMFTFKPRSGDTRTPVLKYGIYDMIKNPDRATNQLPGFKAIYGSSVSLQTLVIAPNRVLAKFIERGSVTLHVDTWGEMPREQRRPGSFDEW